MTGAKNVRSHAANVCAGTQKARYYDAVPIAVYLMLGDQAYAYAEVASARLLDIRQVQRGGRIAADCAAEFRVVGNRLAV